MGNEEGASLKEKILTQMHIEHANALEKNFELAKRFVRITSEGKVDILDKDRYTGLEKITLYLIGKLYAKEAGLAQSEETGNKELMQELGIKGGSLMPWLKTLRDENHIKAVKKGGNTYHVVHLHMVERELKDIEKKMKKG